MMQFLVRRRHNSFFVRAYSTSIISQDSTASSLAPSKSRAALYLLKSETHPEKILDIIRTSTFAPKYHIDRAALNSAVYNLSKQNNPSDVKSLIVELTSNQPNPRYQQYNALKIALLGKAKLVDEAVALFQEIHKPGARGSVKCLNALIYACILAKDFNEMKRVYSEFPSLYNVKPNVETFNRVIKGLCDSGSSSASYSILAEMEEKQVNPNAATFAAMMEGFSAGESRDEVDKLLIMMKEKYSFHSRPSIYNARIKGLCKVKRSEDAYKLLGEMRAKGLKPNAVTYAELILGFCMEGNLEKAKGLFDGMVRCNLKPNSDVYFTLIHFLAEEGDFEKAVILCNESIGKGWVPKFRTMKTMINNLIAVGKFEEAKQLLAKVKGKVEKNLDLWDEIESRLSLS